MITIGEYTSLFLSIVLGIGLISELPIDFFSGADGHRERRFHVEELPVFPSWSFYHCGHRYPDSRRLEHVYFCGTMIALYVASIGIAYVVHPKQRRARKEKKAA